MDNDGQKLISEIEEVLARATPAPQKQMSVSPLFLFTGFFFFLIFLFTITQSSLLLRSLSGLSFIIFVLCFAKTVADVFIAKKRDTLMLVVAIGLLGILGISYFALYEFLIQFVVIEVTIVIAILLFLTTAFYLLHVYLGYLKNKEKQATLITGAIVLGAWLDLMIHGLYLTNLTFFILVVGMIITLKVVGDFSAKFKEK